jgi:PAS domain S-box-containing protein
LDNLRESEEKYRLIFENTPVGVLQFDVSGRITTCNDAFVKIIGSSREVLVGLNMLNLPDKKMVGAITDSLKGSMGYYESEYISTTASKVTPVRGFFAPIETKDKQIRGGVGIIEDFTEKYEADKQIKYREEFENILITLELEFLNTEIGQIDNTLNSGLGKLGSYCRVDRAYIFQLSADQLTMSNSHEWTNEGIEPEKSSLQGIPIDMMPKWMDAIRRSEVIYIPDLEKLSEDWQKEKELLDSQGIRSLIAVPIEIGGELLGFAGFDSVRELRIWNKDEISLLKVLGQIFASVIKRRESNEELVLAKDRAEEANRVKSTFLANMSHEIRTPLNGILGFAELLQTESKDPLVQKYADIILSSGNRLLYTLSQILDLSRVESGQLELVIEPVKVNRVIDDVIFLFSPNAKKKGLFIERQHGGPGMILRLDDQLFRNSLTNLISNALKFTNQGGITISTSIEISNGKRYGIIRVADTGIGIPEKFFDSIFEDFKQVSEGVKRNYEGTGLGLSLTKKFVQLSGGDIKVESMPGFGATFILSFPDPVVE